MPDHKLHITFDTLVLGKPYPEVHKFMDSLQPIMQSNHRAMYHDEKTIAYIYEQTGDIMAAWAAYYHILLDMESDEVGQEYAIASLLSKFVNGQR